MNLTIIFCRQQDERIKINLIIKKSFDAASIIEENENFDANEHHRA